MNDSSGSAACDKAPVLCRDGDKVGGDIAGQPQDLSSPRTGRLDAEGTNGGTAHDNPTLPSWARLPINRCNLPAVILGSLTYQHTPAPLMLDGVHELHRDFFRMLNTRETAEERVQLFHDYMTMCFRLESLEDAGFAPGMAKNRGKLNYLKLIRGWHFNSDSVEGAVLKAWVESRFGLLPRHHRAPIRDFSSEPYRLYLEQRATGLYNTNALESQLDLVYTFTQIELARRYPETQHFRLYRGVNRWEAHEILGERVSGGKRESILLLNNVNSFSTDFERAGEFGDHVIATEVPLTKIICCAQVMPGKLQGEGEALVVGGVYEVRRL
ncbi:NAD(+)--dinitrogen-reductase ADP-D-ribosyltransferase [Uliginosibacterium aquaticum]|uniref:NAD(+)--dinitrogen-reductase ADP-D-ribosyltransferase n=1 Tax=Uliginosibacterium aquaticum TaxID=2731212 RepID=A0ABX2IDP0_9RHOO|nr:NAD(+)--dinitrogen-reductase ADP-D-ribosyltransferase [Uliginosibacterium aquaticum]NSL54721.1 NAD(+)--dinitrogen-reductase ADP-D-ribosyltransferase [Uliginosibacterium aquaticum]